MAAVALVSASCSNGAAREVDPDRWASSVCSTVAGWQRVVGQLAERFDAVVADPTATVEDVRQRFLAFVDGGNAETDRLLGALGDAGVPAADDGDAVARAYEDAFERAEEAFTSAGRAARALPRADTTMFRAELGTVTEGLLAVIDGVAAMLQEIPDRAPGPELVDAFLASPACMKLSGAQPPS
jgi:hypothetical protein